jgi:hypothetical protein
MDKVAFVIFEGSEITLGMAKWSALRRAALFFGMRLGLLSRLSPTLFVPAYEIGIYDCGPNRAFSKQPYLAFYFANEKIAQRKFQELSALLQERGLHSEPLSVFIENGNPSEQGLFLGAWDPFSKFTNEARSECG